MLGPGATRLSVRRKLPAQTPTSIRLAQLTPVRSSPSIPRSSGVRRTYRLVRPSTCSTNVALLQSMFAQTKRRTCRTRRLGWFPIAASASVRSYRLWTRFDKTPYVGQ